MHVEEILSAKKKFRMTPQRQIIHEELKKVKSHPTADEIYYMVRKHIPHISLSTVYRNLEIMSASGIIRKLNLGGTQMHFDADIGNHYHVRCLSCGRVDDMEIDPVFFHEKNIHNKSGYDITGHVLEFIGVCPRCKNKKKKRMPKG